jgi:multiple antibiotic resistance protein
LIESFVEELLRATVALFVVVDPFGNIPIFVELTSSLDSNERKKIFDTAVMSGSLLLLLFAFAGHQLLLLFGISLHSFMIAGGILLLLISLQILVQGGEKWLRESGERVGVFPIGFPLLAGPGAITTTMIAINAYGPLIAVTSIIIVMLLTWYIIRSTSAIYNFMGKTGLDVVAKIMAVFLAAIAVEYMIRGIRSEIGWD